jgi:DNA (cytosine-5)-methyltransferase 1
MPFYASFLSICSGIEAASVAWEPLGWKSVGFSEIDPFPCRLLAHKYPATPNLGTMTEYHEWKHRIVRPRLIVGGTPCQAFSVTGLRKGLDDDRGNLTLTFLRIVREFDPEWVVWENVPGVLSDKTNAFGQLCAGMGELGYGWAYRVLDAKHFGVPHQRRRVFLVGHRGGDWRRSAGVLFDGKGAFHSYFRQGKICKDYANCVTKSYHIRSRAGQGETFIHDDGGIRLLSPIEAERLLGFPDNYTNISGATYKNRIEALGNSMAVPVMRWIGERIMKTEDHARLLERPA